jgi:hypothetical protein
MRSGLELQRCSKQKGAETAKGGQKAKLSVLEERTAYIHDAGERLRKVDAWARAEMKVQKAPEVKGVVKLDAKQATNVREAIEALTRAQALFGLKVADALPKKLDEVMARTKEAKTASATAAAQSDGEEVRISKLQERHAIDQAIPASNEATELVGRLSQSIDASKIAQSMDLIATTLTAARDGKQDSYDTHEVIKKAVKEIKDRLFELRQQFEKTPKSIERVLFVLRSFLALNDPLHAKAPTAAETKAYMSALEGAAEDFNVVFAEGKATHGFDIFVIHAELLRLQFAEREKMAKAGIEAETPVPSQGDAESYFASLKDKPNKEVFAAYTAYMQAFFYHHVEDTFDDLNVTSVADLYKRPLSIVGVRPLVCTGYALLGSHLLAKAGATLDTFIVAVRATRENIVTHNIDAGHALARMKRKGKQFFVSNDLIVSTENEGIGPDAVAWRNSAAPLHKESGKPIPTVNAKLAEQLAAIRAAAQKESGGQKKKGSKP